jgi:hypothetical protein
VKCVVWPLVATALVMASCNRGSTKGSGPQIAAFTDLNPTGSIGKKAKLKLGEITVDCDVEEKKTENTFTIQLKSYGQLFEREVYAYDAGSFSLSDAAGETYDKPLTLLKFPMNVGDSWRWTGTMTSGNEPHKATAQISTSSEQLLLAEGGATDSILVVVDLNLESGGPNDATRKLRFWFVKGKGLVKRQFGIGSTREPAN